MFDQLGSDLWSSVNSWDYFCQNPDQPRKLHDETSYWKPLIFRLNDKPTKYARIPLPSLPMHAT